MASTLIDRIDGLSTGTAIKGPCRVATTANITLYGLQVVDGVSLADGDRVLVKDQTAASENGVYRAETGQWQRVKDFNKTRDVASGTQIFVTNGTANANTSWSIASSNPISVGDDTISFESVFATAEQGEKADAAIPTAQKGVANGVAALDADAFLSDTNLYLRETIGDSLNPIRSWRGYTELNTLTAANATKSNVDGYLRLTGTTTDPNFSLLSQAFDGATERYLVIRYRRTAGNPDSVSTGKDSLIWATVARPTYNFASYAQVFTAPALNVWQTEVLDMWNPTRGGDDWKNGTILNLRWDLGSGSSPFPTIDIAWVATYSDAPRRGDTQNDARYPVKDGSGYVQDTNLRPSLRGENTISNANDFTTPGWATGQNATNAPTNTGSDDWYIYVYEGTTAGPTGTQRARSFFTGDRYIRYVLEGVWSAWEPDYSGAQLDARFVRFVPNTTPTGLSTNRVRVGVNDGRIESVIAGTEGNGWFNSISSIGRAGIVAGTRASDNPTPGDSGAWALGAFAIQDSDDKPAWGAYIEVRIDPGASGAAGAEINPVSRKTLVPNDPVNIYAEGQVAALTLSSGRPDVVGCEPITTFLNLQANGASADKGMNIGYNAVTVTSGQADAINLYKQHAIQQWADTSVRGSRVRFDTTTAADAMQVIFGDSAINVLDSTNVTLFTFGRVVTATALPLKLPSYTKAGKPSAVTAGAGSYIHISNDSRGLAMSDGTNWLFVRDGVTVPAS